MKRPPPRPRRRRRRRARRSRTLMFTRRRPVAALGPSRSQGCCCRSRSGRLFAPEFWHRHYGKVTRPGRSLSSRRSRSSTARARRCTRVVHALAARISPVRDPPVSRSTPSPAASRVRGTLVGTPALNTGPAAPWARCSRASWARLGAAMLLIRPLLRANETREAQGSRLSCSSSSWSATSEARSSPLGDPPLFIGFLKGVDFFWTTRAARAAHARARRGRCWRSSRARPLFLARRRTAPTAGEPRPIAIDGAVNFPLIAGVARRGAAFGHLEAAASRFDVAGTPLELQDLVREVALARAGRCCRSR